MNYDQLVLSKKELCFFIIKGLALGISIGYLFYDSYTLGGVIFLIYLFTLKSYKRGLIEKRRDKLREEFRDLLYSISASISSGRNMNGALRESLEFWKGTYKENDLIMVELGEMVRSIENGNAKDIDLLKDFANRSQIEDIKDFVLVYENSKESGLNVVEALNHASTIIGDKITLEKDIKVMVSEKMFEGKVVAIAPFAILLFLKLSSPEYLMPLYQTVSGRISSTISLTLIFIAYYIVKKIIDIRL